MITIMCPASYASGGPELLHQLGYKLNLLGFNAQMCYVGDPDLFTDPCHPNFKGYNVPYVINQYPDRDGDIVVIPDCYVTYAPARLKRSMRLLWWLATPRLSLTDEETSKIIASLKGPNTLHLAQSEYAIDDLLKHGAERDEILFLGDYINPVHLEDIIPSGIHRSNTVMFNPIKGFDNLVPVIKASSGIIKWQATGDLTPSEVHTAMKQAKVYIDLGMHPGMDRIPREAALGGCCIITNTAGSAGFPDLPIPAKYKHEEIDSESILSQIYDIMDNFDNHFACFNSYREFIYHQYDQFETDVLTIFSSLEGLNIPQTDKDTLLLEIQACLDANDILGAYKKNIIYKALNYPTDTTSRILDISICFAIGEDKRADYMLSRAISLDASSYELYLMKAERLLEQGADDSLIINYLERAIKTSIGTPDEQTVKDICKQIGYGG